jgi:subtilisin family serine protease
MVICFAAGNDGIDEDGTGVIDLGSVSPPGTAKNCITVGASESERQSSPTYGSLRSSSFPKDPIAHDPSANNAEGLAAFSSRGTTADGRIKPDVVAPGTSILSALSRDAQLMTVFGDSPPPGYMFDSGTSMATPLVSGCAALVRQHLTRDRGIAHPSAALIKAMIINGARPLMGQYVPSEAGVPPDPDQGFGLVDMIRTVDPALELHDEGQSLSDTGAVRQFQTTVGPTGSIKVTLVWTDPPGPTLQNDLDLVVSSGAVEAHGNVAVGSPAFDRTNNVEQVSLADLVPNASVMIEVRAFRVALFAQKFALVIRRE